MSIGYAGAFLGGISAILSPCAAMLLPAFFAYAFGRSAGTLLSRTLLFYCGLLVSLLPLGVAAASLGRLLSAHREVVVLTSGVALICFGVMHALGIRVPLPGLKPSGDPRGVVGALLLGITYGLAGSCAGPALGAVLAVAAFDSTPLYGAVLMAVFGAGMVIPLLLLSLLWDRWRIGERIRPRPLRWGPLTTSVSGLVSGVVFVLLGVGFLATDAMAALNGLLAAEYQFKLESWLTGFGYQISDVVFVAVLAVLAALWLWRLRSVSRDHPGPQTHGDQDAHRCQ